MAETKAYSGSGYVQKARGKWRNAVLRSATDFSAANLAREGGKIAPAIYGIPLWLLAHHKSVFFCFLKSVLATHGLKSIEYHDRGYVLIRG